MTHIDREYGWLKKEERREELLEAYCPDQLMKAMKEVEPKFNVNADPWTSLQYQGLQGACGGHALSHIAQVAFMQATGVKRYFSRACGYYESQRYDGIRGDRGCTLAGGQKLMQAGIVLEKDWVYPERYNNRRPANFADLPRLKIPASKPLKTADQIWAFLEAGGAVQTGVSWNNSFEPLFADRAQIGGGGHSTMLYGFHPEKPEYCVHHNSWRGWGDNGRSYWTKNFLNDCLKDPWAVFIGYQATGLHLDKELWTV
jgi:hypothetical protein